MTNVSAERPHLSFVRNVPSVAPQPVFVVGAERSGSTLLRLMLDQHPRLSFPHQLEFAVDWVSDRGDFPEIDVFRDKLHEDPVFLRSGFQLRTALHQDYASLARDFLEQRRGEADFVGGTVHRNFHRLQFVWPNARYIHLVRDPRAVARSSVNMGWDGNVWFAADRWIEAEETWEALAQALPSDRCMTVKYEDLVRDPQSELTRICEFLGIEFDPAMLEFHERSTYEAISPKFTESWRKLDPEMLALLEHKLGPWLHRRGYPFSTADREPSRVDRVRLYVDNRLRKAYFRQQRYGFGLWVKAVVAHRIRPWADEVLREVDRVEATYIK